MPIYVGGRKISGGASSDPSSGLSEGDVYYKTDTDKLRYYNGSAWKDIFPALKKTSIKFLITGSILFISIIFKLF